MTDPNEPTRQFETRIDIAASRDVVFDAIANDHVLRQWFAPKASADSEVGGSIVWTWEDHHTWAQRIEILEPSARLRTRYDSQVDDGRGGKRPLFIDFLLEGEGGTTTLRLVQSGFGADAGFDSEYDGISRGWPVELRSLRLYLEKHAGAERQLVWSTKNVRMDPAAAWQRVTGPDGFACGTAVESLQEGEPFRFHTADGDALAGVALCCHERQFSGVAASHGDAFLRIAAEEWGGLTHLWLWIGAYGHDAAQLAGLQERFDAMLDRLFGAGESSAASPQTAAIEGGS